MLAVVAAAAAGVVGLTTSAAYRLHGPVVALRQLDLLYLDEPAPLADRLGMEGGEPTLVVICRSCRPPPIDVEVVLTAEPDVAAAYALRTRDGGIGSGYAVIDGRRHVRYAPSTPAWLSMARRSSCSWDQVHQAWMDLFALHIGIHFLPAPLLITFTVFHRCTAVGPKLATTSRPWACWRRSLHWTAPSPTWPAS